MARTYVVVLTLLLVTLAGCTGSGPGDTGGTPTPKPDSGDGSADPATGGPDGADGDSSDGADGGTGDDTATAGVWDPYDFRQGEFYAYEVYEGGARVGSFTWEVPEVADDGQSVTVRVTGEFGGEGFETTVSGSPETAYQSLLGNPSGSYIFLALYSPFVGAFQGETLAVGQGWSYAQGGETMSYRIERTDRIADRDAFVTVVRENGVPQYETWVDTELAFAAKTVIYDGGEVDVEVRLVEYRS